MFLPGFVLMPADLPLLLKTRHGILRSRPKSTA